MLVKQHEANRPLGTTSLRFKNNIKLDLKEIWCKCMWTRFIRTGIGPNGRLLQTWQWTIRSHKNQEIYWATEQKYTFSRPHLVSPATKVMLQSFQQSTISCGNRGTLWIRSKNSQVKTQLVLWIFILFYLRWQGDNMFRPLSPGLHQVTSK